MPEKKTKSSISSTAKRVKERAARVESGSGAITSYFAKKPSKDAECFVIPPAVPAQNVSRTCPRSSGTPQLQNRPICDVTAPETPATLPPDTPQTTESVVQVASGSSISSISSKLHRLHASADPASPSPHQTFDWRTIKPLPQQRSNNPTSGLRRQETRTSFEATKSTAIQQSNVSAMIVAPGMDTTGERKSCRKFTTPESPPRLPSAALFPRASLPKSSPPAVPPASPEAAIYATGNMDTSPTTPRKRAADTTAEAPKIKRIATDPGPGTKGSSAKALGNHCNASDSRLDIGRTPTSPRKEKLAPPPIVNYNIVHNPEVMSRMARYRIPMYARWWIAGAILSKKVSWGCLTDDIFRQLQGPNAEVMPRLLAVLSLPLKLDSFDHKDYAVWRQLDLEEAARAEAKDRGLGCLHDSSDYPGDSYIDLDGRVTTFEKGFYGGQVEFPATLTSTGQAAKKRYSLILKRPKLGKSRQFTRFVGSANCIVLKCGDADAEGKMSARGEMSDLEIEFLGRSGLLVMGLCYTLICAKDGKAYMAAFKSNASEGGFPATMLGAMRVLNDPELNAEQLLSKYTSRMDLFFSTSVPAVRVEEENILYRDDLRGDGDGADFVKTDGHCYANVSFFNRAAENLGAPVHFTLQGRIKGSKGLWSLNPDPSEHNPRDPPKIWISKSQSKVKYSDDNPPSNPTLLIFNLLRTPRVSVAALSRQLILNFHAHYIPDTYFVKLLDQSLRDDLNPLISWYSGPGSMLALAQHISGTGRLKSRRLARCAGGESRALGYSVTDDDGADLLLQSDTQVSVLPDELDATGSDDDSDDASLEISTDRVAWRPETVKRDQHSGLPALLTEAATELLHAGFRPNQQAYLQNEIKALWDTRINSILTKLRFVVEDSSQAWGIPDWTGELPPKSIYFRSSKGLLDPHTNFKKDVLTGKVLIGRSPVRLMSDIQVVEAVDMPQFRQLQDVIVFSTQGPTSMASEHSGGDYDGDTFFVFWDSGLLASFRDKDCADAPEIQQDMTIRCEDAFLYWKAVKRWGKSEEQKETIREALLLKALAKMFQPNFTGIYSNLHEYATYWFGYDSLQALRLGTICNAELDSKKQGYGIRTDILAHDVRKFNFKPECFPAPSKDCTPKDIFDGPKSPRKPKDLKRTGHLSERDHVLDVLKKAAERLKEEYDAQWMSLQSTTKSDCFEVDEDVMRVYRELEQVAARFPKSPDPPLDALSQDGTRRTRSQTKAGSAMGTERWSAFQQELRWLKSRVESTYKAYLEHGLLLAKGKLSSDIFNSKVSTLARDLFDFTTSPPDTALQHITSSQIQRYIAAYCYVLAYKGVKEGHVRVAFPFRMAFSVLCAIKAEAQNKGVCFSAGYTHADTMLVHDKLASATLAMKGSSTGSSSRHS